MFIKLVFNALNDVLLNKLLNTQFNGVFLSKFKDLSII